MLVSLASAKGAPGVTTSAHVLAGVWPRSVILAELDPAGSDLLYRASGQDGRPLDPERGLVSLAAAQRRDPTADLHDHLSVIDGGLQVLVGLARPEQASAIGAGWATLAAGLRRYPDVIADVVSTGRTLRQHGLTPFGEPLINSEAIVVARTGAEITPEMMVLLRRMEGILHAHNFLMLDYNVEHHLLEQAKAITPGISGPTVSPLALDNWVAVRAMVPKPEANAIMDRLAHLGAQAILATEIRIARL